MDPRVLTDIGFTEKESAVYLALLKRNDAPASAIAEDLGYDRTTTYYLLLRMVEKGYVSTVVKDGKKQFIATEPKKILLLLKDRQDKFAALLPQLTSLGGESPTRIEVLQGRTGLNRLFKEVLEDGSELVSFGVDEQKFIEYGSVNFKIYAAKVEKGAVKERLLTTAGTQTVGKKSRYRFIPAQFFSSLPTAVFGNKVALIIWEPILQIILIENAQLADSFKKMFEFTWKNAK